MVLCVVLYGRCGCTHTCVAGESFQRGWVGADVPRVGAVELCKRACSVEDLVCLGVFRGEIVQVSIDFG